MDDRDLYEAKRLQIGNTPLIKCPELGRQFGAVNLLVKDESKNPFGTFKDRRNALVIDQAIEEHVDKLALITSGNAGYSLARLAQGTGLKVVCIADLAIDPDIRKELERYSYKVVAVDLKKKIFPTEDVFGLARETSDEVILDVTNGYHAAFQSIVTEIEEEAPDYLVTPVGSGEAFVGLYEGLKRYRLKTILVGVGVHHKSNHELKLQATPSIADKLYTPYTPYKKRIERILEEGNLYIHVSDEQIIKAYKNINLEISCEPSSAAAFASLPELDVSKSNKVVVVSSGKGIWAQQNRTVELA